MSSRRKQSKPKAFGTNDSLEVGDTATTNEQTTEPVAQTNGQEGSNAQSLAPIPSTDLLSFNSQKNLTLPIVNNNSITVPVIESADDSNKRKRDETDVIIGEENMGDLTALNDEEGDEDDAMDDNDFNLEDDEFAEETNTQMNLISNVNTYGNQSLTIVSLNETGMEKNLSLNSSLNMSQSDLSATSNLLVFKCKVCGKGFKHRRSLNRHVRLHSGEKNYKCPHCTTAFARSDHLKAHIRTHNNSKPYRCSVCQCGYNTQAALKVHIAHHHSKSKFKCALCNNLEFHSQLALEGHVYTKHSKGDTDLDLDTALMTNTKTNSINNKINDMNENEFNYENNETFFVKPDVSTTSQITRVKLADINNYSKDDLSEETVFTNGYNSMYSYSNENRENLAENGHIEPEVEGLIDTSNEDVNNENMVIFYDDLNDSVNNPELNENTNMINKSETATVIDNYGEDDDEENHSDLSSSSLNKLNPIDEQMNNDDLDDIIIEENLCTKTVKMVVKSNESDLQAINADRFKRLAPKITQTNGNINKNIQKPLPTPPPLILANANRNLVNKTVVNPINKNAMPVNINNTYCEMCNARFSNVESFQAHMRNCHPNIHQQQQRIENNSTQPVKMPFLTSVLSKVNSTTSLPNGKPVNETNGIIITNNGIIVTGANQLTKTTTCSRPNCNCSTSLSSNCSNRCNKLSPIKNSDDNHDPNLDFYYAIKETHYTCSQCNLTLYKVNDYIAHLKHEHCVEVFRCILCKQMQLFDNLNLLKEHFFQEHQSQKYDYYRCRLCINPVPSSSSSSLLFNNLEELNNHLKTIHHINAPMPPNSLPNGNKNDNGMRITQTLPAHVVSTTLSMPPPPPPPPPPPISQVHLPIHLQQPPIPIYSQVSHSHSSTQHINNSSYTHPSSGHQFNNYNDRFNSYTNNSNKCFKCNYCDSDFAQQSYLNQHIQMVHGSNKVTNTNGSAPPIPQQINNYAPNIPTQSVYSCQYCRSTFSNRSLLERHVRIHVSSIDLKCNICDKIFESQELLSQHKLTHTKVLEVNKDSEAHQEQTTTKNNAPSLNSDANAPTAAVCVYCKLTIENESMFKEHFKRHNNIGANNQGCKVNSFICIICRQTLTSNSEYNLHMRHHLRRVANNSQVAIAPLNGANIPKNNLPNQLPVRSTQKPEVNNKDKIEQDDLNKTTEASKTSTDDSSKLRCSKCLVKFEVWQELADHIAEVHSSKGNDLNKASSNNGKASLPTNPAPVEPIKEKTQVVIKQERQSPPPLPVVQQEKDPKKQRLDTNGSDHVSTNGNNPNNNFTTDLCEICSSKFDSNAKLQCHLLIKHEFGNSNGLFTCPVCDEGFARPENLIQHTYSHGQAAKIYKCTECNFAYVFKAQLINHSFSHHQQNSSSRQLNNTEHNIQSSQQQQTGYKRINPVNITSVTPSIIYKNNNNGNNGQMIRTRQIITNQNFALQYPQQNSQMQRLRCHECNIEFNSFRFYQHHCQTVHNRTIIQNNNYLTSSNSSSIMG